MQKIKKSVISLILSLISAVLVLGAALISFPKNVSAMTSTSTVTVGGGVDLAGTNGGINATVLNDLYTKLTTGSGQPATLDGLKQLANTAASTSTGKWYAGYTAKEISAKAGGDLIINFGGLNWTVVFLSEDRNGDPVATLWLMDRILGYDKIQWNTWYGAQTANKIKYPSSMYSVSNARAALNLGTQVVSYSGANGGTPTDAQLSLSTNVKLSSTKTVSGQQTDSPFAPFTMTDEQLSGTSKKSLMKYLDMPYLIEYQEKESWIYQGDKNINLPGSSYGYPETAAGSYPTLNRNGYVENNDHNGNFDFNSYSLIDYLINQGAIASRTLATNAHNSANGRNTYVAANMQSDLSSLNIYNGGAAAGEKWKTTEELIADGAMDTIRGWVDGESWAFDTLWLPSVEEYGWADTTPKTNVTNTIWGTSLNQRTTSDNAAWTRNSGYNGTDFIPAMLANGAGSNKTKATDEYALRPALHLNLKLAEEHAGSFVPEAQNSAMVYTAMEQEFTFKNFATDYVKFVKSERNGTAEKVGTFDQDSGKFKATESGTYTLTFEPQTGHSWNDTDTTEERTMTVTITPAEITVDFSKGNGFGIDNVFEYQTNKDSPDEYAVKHALKFPDSEYSKDTRQIISLCPAATDDDKESVRIFYIVVTHDENAHGSFDVTANTPSESDPNWEEYDVNKANLNVSDPGGYCVYFKIVANNHHLKEIGHFSVHIATETLVIDASVTLPNKVYGSAPHTQADLIDLITITSITDQKTGEERLDKLDKSKFRFYFKKDGTEFHTSDDGGSSAAKWDAGIYDLWVRYIEPGKENFIHFEWKNGRPKFTIDPLEVEVEWKGNPKKDDEDEWKAYQAQASDSNPLTDDEFGWVYDGEEHCPTATFKDVNGDSQTLTVTGGQSEANDVGETYTAKAEKYSNNYTFKANTDEQKFSVHKAKNEWTGQYRRRGWAIGGTPSDETKPTAKFGTPKIDYYLDEARESQLFTGLWTEFTENTTIYVRATVEDDFNYDGLDSIDLPDQTRYSFTLTKCDQHSPTTTEYLHDADGHWLECSKCGSRYNEDDHTPAGSYFSDDNRHWQKCSVCGEDCGFDTHDLQPTDTWEVQSTCEQDGMRIYKCACGKSEVRNVGKSNHVADEEWHSDGNTHWHECTACGTHMDEQDHDQVDIPAKDPTCLIDGNTKGVECSVCKKVLIPTTVRPHRGHQYDEADLHVIKAATCDVAGEGEANCTVCGEPFPVTIEAKGHTGVEHPAVEPTATTAGNIQYWECSVCHKLFNTSECAIGAEITRESTILPALGMSGGNAEGSGGVAGNGEDVGNFLRDNWWWIVLIVAVLLLIIILFMVISTLNNRRRERLQRERELERDRQFDALLKMQMMHYGFGAGGFAGGTVQDGATPVEGQAPAQLPYSQEMIDVAVAAALSAMSHMNAQAHPDDGAHTEAPAEQPRPARRSTSSESSDSDGFYDDYDPNSDNGNGGSGSGGNGGGSGNGGKP